MRFGCDWFKTKHGSYNARFGPLRKKTVLSSGRTVTGNALVAVIVLARVVCTGDTSYVVSHTTVCCGRTDGNSRRCRGVVRAQVLLELVGTLRWHSTAALWNTNAAVLCGTRPCVAPLREHHGLSTGARLQNDVWRLMSVWGIGEVWCTCVARRLGPTHNASWNALGINVGSDAH